MKRFFSGFGLVALGLAIGPVGPLFAKDRVAETLHSASEVLEQLPNGPAKCIPPALLREAQGVAIIPNVIKVGLGLGARHGDGVVIARGKDGGWTNPVFVSLTGGSVGWQAGVESADVVLVFRTRKGVERLLHGKGKLTLGADAAIAAGPLGRQAEADTDVRLRAEIYSYSKSRGLFAGLSLEGAAILQQPRANERFATRPTPEDLHEAAHLLTQLAALCNPAANIVPLARHP